MRSSGDEVLMKSFIPSANLSTWLACTPDEIYCSHTSKMIRDPEYFPVKLQI